MLLEFISFLRKIKVFDHQSEVWYLQECKFGDEGVEGLC